MLRLTEIHLPLDHDQSEIEAAILERLLIAPDELLGFTIFRRSYDARKRSAITLIYSVDVEVWNEAALLQRWRGNPKVTPTPDMSYRFVAQAPADLATRPVVIGTGPCGLFAGLRS